MSVTDKGKGRAPDQDADAELFDVQRVWKGLEEGTYSSLSPKVAWCPTTGLIAYPASSPRDTLLPLRSPAVNLTLPASGTHIPPVNFTIQLPDLGQDYSLGHESIHRLSFSPDGNVLIVWTLFDPFQTGNLVAAAGLIPLMKMYAYLRMENLNQPWLCIFDWNSCKARPSGPIIRNIVDMQWLGSDNQPTKNENGKRTRCDLFSKCCNWSFLAVTDTGECILLVLESAEAVPEILITSLESPGESTQNIAVAGSSLAPMSMMSDPLASVLQSAPLGQDLQPAGISIRQEPKRSITHAAISSSRCSFDDLPTPDKSEGEEDAYSRLLVACKSKRRPNTAISATQVAASVAPLPPKLPDQPAISNADPLADLSTFNGPSSLTETPAIYTDDLLPAAPITQDSNGNSNALHLSSRVFDDPYGDINMAALDEMFDFDGGLGDTLSGLGNSVGSSSDINVFADNTFDATPAAEGSIHSSPSKEQNSESPSKSFLGSPQKSSKDLNGMGSGNVSRAESQSIDPADDVLPGQSSHDDEDGNITFWEVNIRWGQLLLETRKVQDLPLLDIVDQPSTSALSTTTLTQLHFTPSNSLLIVTCSSPFSSTLAGAASSSQMQTVTTSRQHAVLSEAFSSFEARKKDPTPAMTTGKEASELGTCWVLKRSLPSNHAKGSLIKSEGIDMDVESKGRDSATETSEIVLDVLPRSSESVWLLMSGKSGLLTLKALDLLTLSVVEECCKTLAATKNVALSMSPSGHLAMACAFDIDESGRTTGRPAIFILPMTPTIQTEDDLKAAIDADGPSTASLGKSLSDAIIHGRSRIDFQLLSRTRNPQEKNFGEHVVRSTWENLSALLGGLKVEQSKFILPLLSVQGLLLGSPHSQLTRAIIQLIACYRLLLGSKIAQRNRQQQPGQPQAPAETFEPTSIWPIIGHIAYIFRLWDSLIVKMIAQDFDQNWPTSAFLLIHPFPRSLQQRLIRLIARFANFVMALKEGSFPGYPALSSILDIEVARSVLSDLILSNRNKTQEWSGMLHGLQLQMGDSWSGDSEKARSSLMKMELPEELRKLATETSKGVKAKLSTLINEGELPARKATRTDQKRVFDIINQSDLTSQSAALNTALRQCTDCGGYSALPKMAGALQTGMPEGESQLNVESEWEFSKRRSCLCGGMWVVVQGLGLFSSPN